jgi:hypothetical protein
MDLRKLGLTITIENYVEDLSSFLQVYKMKDKFKELFGITLEEWDYTLDDVQVVNMLLQRYKDSNDKIYFCRTITMLEEQYLEIFFISEKSK